MSSAGMAHRALGTAANAGPLHRAHQQRTPAGSQRDGPIASAARRGSAGSARHRLQPHRPTSRPRWHPTTAPCCHRSPAGRSAARRTVRLPVRAPARPPCGGTCSFPRRSHARRPPKHASAPKGWPVRDAGRSAPPCQERERRGPERLGMASRRVAWRASRLSARPAAVSPTWLSQSQAVHPRWQKYRRRCRHRRQRCQSALQAW